MAKKDPTIKSEATVSNAAAPAVSDADDGGQSNRTKGYSKSKDRPDDSTIAQVEELKPVGANEK